MVDSSLSISFSQLVTLYLLWLSMQNFVQRFPLVSGIPGFPYCTNELALSSPLWNYLSFSLSLGVDLGLIPLKLLVVEILALA